jgi:integrase
MGGGIMAVYKDKNRGTWFIRTRIKLFDGSSKEVTKRGFRTKAAAQQEEQLIKTHNMDAATHVVNFNELAIHFLTDNKKRVTGTTFGQKKHTVETYILPYFSRFLITKIQPLDINNWQNHILDNFQLSDNTLKRLTSTLSSIFKHGMKYFSLNTNPVAIVGGFPKQSQNTKHVNFWEVAEFNQFYAAITDLKYQAIFLLFYYSGLRAGELCVLKWTDLDADYLKITKSLTRDFKNDKFTIIVGQTKTRHERTLQLPHFVVNKLITYKKYCTQHFPNFNDSFFMFGTKNNWLAKTTLQRHFTRYQQAAAVKKIRIHDLRHSHASYLISKNVDIVLIANRLGHLNPKQTLDTYSHMFPSREKEVISSIQDCGY